MADHVDWPPLQRYIDLGLRAVMYAASTVAGYGVLVHQPSLLASYAGGELVTLLGWMAVAGGAVGVFAAALRNWHLEWLAAIAMTGSFGAYTALEWALVLDGYPARFTTAAALTVATLAPGIRSVGLWMFSKTVRKVRRDRVLRWKRVARELDR